MTRTALAPALALALAVSAVSAPALADVEKIALDAPVGAAMDRLEAAVTKAGATIFARVDHGGGAMKAGMELAPAELLIFGNALLGTPAMQADPLAGLYLPLKILIYQDAEGQVWAAYEQIEATFDGLDIDPSAEFVGKMKGALGKLSAAAGG